MQKVSCIIGVDIHIFQNSQRIYAPTTAENNINPETRDIWPSTEAVDDELTALIYGGLALAVWWRKKTKEKKTCVRGRYCNGRAKNTNWEVRQMKS
jgi:hypothetical protein